MLIRIKETLQGRLFCCFCSIRTGASMIGWFNFVFNSLYVGMLLFALARIKEEVGTRIDFYEEAKRNFSLLQQWHDDHSQGMSKFSDQSSFEGSGMPTTKINVISTVQDPHRLCSGVGMTYDCLCNAQYVSTIKSCRLSFEIKTREEIVEPCLCEFNYIMDSLVMLLYKSCALPGMLIAISVLWLTVVESRNRNYIKFVGLTYLFVIPLQLLLQLIFLIYVDNHFKESGVGPLNHVVWIVFGIYAALNIYFIPILKRFLYLRNKEFTQGVDQGFLTSENVVLRYGLDTYLEDIFTTEDDYYNADHVQIIPPDATLRDYGTS